MSEVNISIAILAGGTGARFWPLSRHNSPKQFLPLGETGDSLIQATVRRLEQLVPREQMVVITSSHLTGLVEEHVPGVKIIAEPCGRNTAAAIALGASWLDSQSFEGVMIALPADHAVKNDDNLVKSLKRAAEVASSSDQLVTIGISPERPDTAFGYVQRGESQGDQVYEVKRFFEKPSELRAKQYLESGDFYWNSGMFAWQPKVFLQALKNHLPDMHKIFDDVEYPQDRMPTVEELDDIYSKVESISVDFGIMEHAKNVSVVEAYPYGWNDVGSWDSWADQFETDGDGNLLKGDCISIDGSGNVISSDGRFVAVVGTEDLVVIDSADALLVCPRNKVQDVRKVVDHLKSKDRRELI